jgi:hypothetical protein
MALDTFANLKTAIADHLNRGDLTSYIPDFITLAEAQMQRDLSKHYLREARTTLTVDGQFEDVPSDFYSPVRLSLQGKHRPLELMSLAEMQGRRDDCDDETGEPLGYAINGADLEFWPSPNDTYTADLVYIQTITALSDANTSNWLLVNGPDAYLYGSLIHSAPFLRDDERIGVWAALYKSAIDGLNHASTEARFGGTGLRMR